MNDERPMNQTDELMADDELTELRKAKTSANGTVFHDGKCLGNSSVLVSRPLVRPTIVVTKARRTRLSTV